jgi:3-hydroxyisobutyrate dehydrogenase-like beta-hydroxyacid dehydrogenase
VQVSIIGTGLMGQAMAERLLSCGFTVIVHNRTREKAMPLLEKGAVWADSPAEAAAKCPVTLSIVTDPAAVEAISLGSEGVLDALAPESVHADMSTVSPASAQRMAWRYRERGRRFVQAPVLGSRRQIESGELLVFAGGDSENVARCEPVWSPMAARLWRFEQASQAAVAKLACNMMIAHLILGLGQSLLFAQAGGVPPERLLEILGASALGCPMFASKGKTLLERNFRANFFIRHMEKDLTLALEAARTTGMPSPFLAMAHELFLAAMNQGWGEEDYSAVVKTLEQMAGISLSAQP